MMVYQESPPPPGDHLDSAHWSVYITPFQLVMMVLSFANLHWSDLGKLRWYELKTFSLEIHLFLWFCKGFRINSKTYVLQMSIFPPSSVGFCSFFHPSGTRTLSSTCPAPFNEWRGEPGIRSRLFPGGSGKFCSVLWGEPSGAVTVLVREASEPIPHTRPFVRFDVSQWLLMMKLEQRNSRSVFLSYSQLEWCEDAVGFVDCCCVGRHSSSHSHCGFHNNNKTGIKNSETTLWGLKLLCVYPGNLCCETVNGGTKHTKITKNPLRVSLFTFQVVRKLAGEG